MTAFSSLLQWQLFDSFFAPFNAIGVTTPFLYSVIMLTLVGIIYIRTRSVPIVGLVVMLAGILGFEAMGNASTMIYFVAMAAFGVGIAIYSVLVKEG